MIDAAAQHAKALRRVLHVHLSFVLHILRWLEIVQRDGPFVVEELSAFELDARELCVGDRLSVIGKRSGQVRALQAQQKLALLYRVAEARVNLYHAAGGYRNDRNASRDVWAYCPGHRQL